MERLDAREVMTRYNVVSVLGNSCIFFIPLNLAE